MDIKKLPINEMIEFKLETDFQPLNPAIVDKIITLLTDNYRLKHGLLAMFPIASLSTAIEWKWNAERGTLPKRIGNWYYKTFNDKLSDELLSIIGNIAREEIPKAQTYYFDITDKFNWLQGDFGDHDSCFFNGKKPGPRMQTMAALDKFKAIRFFKPIPKGASIAGINQFYTTEEKGFIGISRAFMYENDRAKKVGKENITYPVRIIFNGYGLSTLKVASILSGYAGVSQKYIKFDSEWLYINENGYAIGDDNILRDVDNVRTCAPLGYQCQQG